MSILQMSFYGSIIILATIAIRAFGKDKLPKRAILLLWAVAAVRLIMPIQISSPLSIYNYWEPPTVESIAPASALSETSGNATIQQVGYSQAANTISGKTVFALIWTTGIVVCVLYFTVKHLRSKSVFTCALPVDNEFVSVFSRNQALKRNVTVKYSDLIAAPLTYGVFRPIVLLPKDIDWTDEKNLQLILVHEFQHIKSFDVLKKLVLLAVLCVHWFNPLVWVMFFLANRDIELACDEAVIRELGEGYRATYARALLDMEEWRSIHYPLASYFSKSAVKKRIIHIMKYKKIGSVSIIVALLIIIATVAVFATSADDKKDSTEIEETVQTSQGTQSNVNITYRSLANDGDKDVDEEVNKLDVEYILSRFGQYGVTYDGEGFKYDGTIVKSLILNVGTEQETAYLFNYLDWHGIYETDDYLIQTKHDGTTELISKWDFYGETEFDESVSDKDVEYLLSIFEEFGLTYNSDLNCFMYEGDIVRSIELLTGEDAGEGYEYSQRIGIRLFALVDEEFNIIGLTTHGESYF